MTYKDSLATLFITFITSSYVKKHELPARLVNLGLGHGGIINVENKRMFICSGFFFLENRSMVQ